MPRPLSVVAAAAAAVFAVVGLAPSPAAAQVVYEPVEYQYRSHGRTYYYGGTDPQVFAFADAASCARAAILDGSRFYDADVGFVAARNPPNVSGTDKPVVYADCLPYVNAHFYGFTPSDARNAAYAATPRHFTKAGLLRAAIPAGRATVVVPDKAAPVPARRAPATATGGVAPATKPGAVIIIPKRLLDRKLSDFQKQVAAAQ